MYILFDIGGSKMRLAASRDLKSFGEPVVLRTPRDFKKGMALFCETVKKLAGGKKIKAIGGGIAGPLDRARTRTTNAPNITTWRNKPLKTSLKTSLKTAVYLENDTALVGLGETHFGAGKKFKKEGVVAYITVSTGVGGARVVDGRVDRNTYGFEIGWQTIDADGTVCPAARSPGYLEEYISGKNVERRTGEKPYDIHDKKFWDTEARLLAWGLNNTAVHWSPELIILGGSMINGTKKVVIPLDRVRFYFNKVLKIFPEKPKLVKAELGDYGGLYGSMIYLKQVLSIKY